MSAVCCTQVGRDTFPISSGLRTRCVTSDLQESYAVRGVVLSGCTGSVKGISSGFPEEVKGKLRA